MTKPKLVPVGCITEVRTKTAFGGTVGIIPQMYGSLPVGTLLYTAPPQPEPKVTEDMWEKLSELQQKVMEIAHTAPPKKEWVGLTDEERKDIFKVCAITDRGYVAAMVEAKLKEKNT